MQDGVGCNSSRDRTIFAALPEMPQALPDFTAPPISPQLQRFERLIAPIDDGQLERMARESAAITRRHFGRAMRLFAPLYLSNECINTCAYCGFSRDNAINRVTLEVASVVAEARHLVAEGFRNILLVAGEHPKFVSQGYLERCVEALKPEVPSIALEVAPMEAPEYARLSAAGAEGLILYQETYHRETYRELHTAGPKKDYDWRLAGPERAYEGGFRRIGIGALLGLADWRFEARALAAHLQWLLRKCWKSQFTLSLPRLRPCAGEFEPRYPISDREFVQLVCALRMTFPEVGLVLSTREPASLRDALLPLGITMMSAGSHTEPGGYTGEGKNDVHRTKGGRIGETLVGATATEQFQIADQRSAAEIASLLHSQGFEPVWKDWDQAILEKSETGNILAAR